MQPILAEEIRDFDTSLDRLWARRDLVVVAAGALICFRSIYAGGSVMPLCGQRITCLEQRRKRSEMQCGMPHTCPVCAWS